jgi:hypothetical protein
MKKLIIYALAVCYIVLASYTIAHSETEAYLTFESSGAGYDSGIGARLEHTQRWDWFGLHGVGRYALQHKTGADSGYTYGLRGEARGYWKDFYASAGYGLSGYRSKFANGAVWSKRGWQPHVGVGYDGERFDVGVSYAFRENDTVNRVKSASISAAWKPVPDSGLKVMGGLTRMWFEQAGVGMSETIGSFGVGWEF